MKDYILLDGGVGTSLWEKTDDKNPVWTFNFTHPDLVKELADEMVNAGSDIVLANTFGANRPNVEKEEFGHSVTEIVTRAVELAKEAVAGRAKIALGIGALTGLLEPYGNIAETDAADYFHEMIDAGVKAGVDYIYLQTFMDLHMLEIAVAEAAKYDVPFYCSMSFDKYTEENGTRSLFGDTPAKVVETLAKYNPIAMGINCTAAPEEVLPMIHEFASVADRPVIFKPNAGKPQANGGSEIDYEDFAKTVASAADLPNVKYFGGCCGANAKYIAALKKELDKK